ncbi:MAG: hypothetical protein AAFX06_04675 [Planctomycetota bacterium]
MFRYSQGEFVALGGPINANPGGADIKLAVDPIQAGRVYVANSVSNSAAQQGVWRFDSGEWTRVFSDNWVRNVAVDPVNPGRLAIITDKAPFGDTREATGVWVSTNFGDGWVQANAGLPMLRGQHINFSSDGLKLVVGLTGRGFYEADFPIDGIAPVADILDVESGVDLSAIDIVFSEPVEGFDLSDLTLTRNDQAILLDSASIEQTGDLTFRLVNLDGLLNRAGDYRLTLAESGSDITDLAGNPMESDAIEEFSVVGTAYSFDRDLQESVVLGHEASMQLDEGSLGFAFAADSPARGTLFSKDSRGRNDGDLTIEWYRSRVYARFETGGSIFTLVSRALPVGEQVELELRFGAAGFQLHLDGELAAEKSHVTAGLGSNAEDVVLGASAFKSDVGANNRLTRFFGGQISGLEFRDPTGTVVFDQLVTA